MDEILHKIQARLTNDLYAFIGRLDLLIRILIVNLGVVLGGAFFGTWLTQQTVLAKHFTYVTYLVLTLAAILIGAVVNLVVLQMALRPLVSLQRTVRERKAGNQAARALLGAGADPDVLRLAAAFNDMLDDLDEKTSVIERNNGQLTLLAAAVIRAQEQERQRVARELHDDVGQALSMVVMSLEHGLQVMPEREAQARQMVQKLRDIVLQTLDGIHNLALDLRPAMLDDLGLVPTLRWYLRRYQETAGLDIVAELPEWESRLPPEMETSIFRIVQEAMANVAKHSQAHCVTVSLERSATAVRIAIADDGKGFDVQTTLNSRNVGRMGLINMQERASLLNGSCQIQSTPGCGTTVAVFFPFAGTAPGDDTA